MDNYTSNTAEMKREIVKFSEFMSRDCQVKAERDFLRDMLYGIIAAGDLKLSEIARALKENIELDNTVERLSNHLKDDIEGIESIKHNYYEFVKGMIPDKPVVDFDNSDITKTYARKLEYLDKVVDASDPEKKVKNGYPVVNAVVLGKNQKQPIPVYSKIVSTQDPTFESMNTYTIDSIKTVHEAIGKFTGVMDRGYDDKKIFRLMNELGLEFVIRLKGNRKMLFKGRSKNVLDQALSRKGKLVFKAKFSDGEKNLTISYTRANLTDGKHEEFTLVFVYGLGNEPLMLITNKKIETAHDARLIVRMYIDRWRIEEVHRSEKQSFNYEDMRVQTLKSMNNLNTIFNMLLGFICKLIEQRDTRLLSIKIMEASQSLREDLVVFIGLFARGIKEILKYARVGVSSFKRRRFSQHDDTYLEQLSLQL